ncbi:MAG: hypothetical protein WC675_03295 [Patescibacteria group bacterium]|jgi:hypothetical protein
MDKTTKNLLIRVEKLENAVFGTKKKIKTATGDEKSLSNHIIGLRDRSTFRQPLTPKEIHEKLESTYPCDLSRVKVELIRLQKRRQLRKTSKLIGKKRYVAYVW